MSESDTKIKPWSELSQEEKNNIKNQLIESLKNGETEEAKKLINDYPELISEIYIAPVVISGKEVNCELNLLHIIALNGYDEIAKYILDENKNKSIQEQVEVAKEVKDKDDWTPLHYACANNRPNIVEYLIEKQYVDKEAKNVYNETPLHSACVHGHLNIVEYLIEKQHVNKEAKDEGGCIPLHFACANGHLNVVDYLIEQQHVNKEEKNKAGCTPLHFACANGQLGIVKYLIEKQNVNIEATSIGHKTPLYFACEKESISTVLYLLIKGVNPDVEITIDGKTEVFPYGFFNENIQPYLKEFATLQQKIKKSETKKEQKNELLKLQKEKLKKIKEDKTITEDDKKQLDELINDFDKQIKLLEEEILKEKQKELIDAFNENDQEKIKRIIASYPELINEKYTFKINIGSEEYDFEGNLLHIIAMNGYDKIAKYILEENKDKGIQEQVEAAVKAKDEFNRSPLHYACENGHLNIVKYLIEKQNVNKEAKDRDGWTPLYCACENGHLNVVQYLIEKQNVNKEAKDDKDRTPLHYACANDQLDVVSYLIEKQHVNKEATDEDDYTPLHYACENGHLNIVKYLIEQQHVNKEAKDEDGRTPLHLACRQNDHLNVVKYLIEKQNVNIEAKDEDGRTPLQIACTNNQLNTAISLIENGANPLSGLVYAIEYHDEKDNYLNFLNKIKDELQKKEYETKGEMPPHIEQSVNKLTFLQKCNESFQSNIEEIEYAENGSSDGSQEALLNNFLEEIDKMVKEGKISLEDMCEIMLTLYYATDNINTISKEIRYTILEKIFSYTEPSIFLRKNKALTNSLLPIAIRTEDDLMIQHILESGAEISEENLKKLSYYAFGENKLDLIKGCFANEQFFGFIQQEEKAKDIMAEIIEKCSKELSHPSQQSFNPETETNEELSEEELKARNTKIIRLAQSLSYLVVFGNISKKTFQEKTKEFTKNLKDGEKKTFNEEIKINMKKFEQEKKKQEKEKKEQKKKEQKEIKKMEAENSKVAKKNDEETKIASTNSLDLSFKEEYINDVEKANVFEKENYGEIGVSQKTIEALKNENDLNKVLRAFKNNKLTPEQVKDIMNSVLNNNRTHISDKKEAVKLSLNLFEYLYSFGNKDIEEEVSNLLINYLKEKECDVSELEETKEFLTLRNESLQGRTNTENYNAIKYYEKEYEKQMEKSGEVSPEEKMELCKKQIEKSKYLTIEQKNALILHILNCKFVEQLNQIFVFLVFTTSIILAQEKQLKEAKEETEKKLKEAKEATKKKLNDKKEQEKGQEQKKGQEQEKEQEQEQIEEFLQGKVDALKAENEKFVDTFIFALTAQVQTIKQRSNFLKQQAMAVAIRGATNQQEMTNLLGQQISV